MAGEAKSYCPHCGVSVAEDALQCHGCDYRPEEADAWELDSFIGRTVNGRYRVLGRLGQGGFGVIYEVVHVELGAHRALKRPHAHVKAAKDSLERFRREANTLAAFSHPHVMRVEDFGYYPEDRPYIVLELIEGESLAEVLEREYRPLSDICPEVSVPESLERLVSELLAADPDQRPSSAVEVQRRFDEVARDLGLGSARAAPEPAPASPPRPRRHSSPGPPEAAGRGYCVAAGGGRRQRRLGHEQVRGGAGRAASANGGRGRQEAGLQPAGHGVGRLGSRGRRGAGQRPAEL